MEVNPVGSQSQVVFPGLSTGPGMFSIFINNLDKGIESTLSQCADGTELGWRAGLWELGKALQRNLQRI